MSVASELLNNSRKIVLKIGSNVLADSSGMLDNEVIKNIVDQVSFLREKGKQVVIVSSGAEISGISAINLRSRHGDINYKQAMCAIGQVELMMAYKKCFAKNNTVVAQMLLSSENFSDSNSSLHIRNTLFTLLDENVVPIVNENDSVCVDEMSIGDNDSLAAMTSNLWNADILILMSDIDGVFDKPPKNNKDAHFISIVEDIQRLEREIEVSGKSSFGTGGMITKIEAAKTIKPFGTSMMLANGKSVDILKDLMEGKGIASVFIAE